MPISARIYLDHAATSWPKLPGVAEAVFEYQQKNGASAGRAGYRSAFEAQQIVDSLRRRLADWIHAPEPSSIAYAHNGTAALNLAFASLLQSGDHVIATAADHNSLLRPLAAMAQSGKIELSIVGCDERGWVDPTEIRDTLRSNTKLVAMTHASNVTGRIQTIEAIGKIVAEGAAFFLVDAAQTLGYLPIDVQESQIDLLAAPGHKGGGGVFGTGFLYAHPRIHQLVHAPWPGGTGLSSERLEIDHRWPTDFEAGNLNIPAFAGWLVGVESLQNAQQASELDACYEHLRDTLRRWPLGELIGHESNADYVPVFSLKTREDLPPSELASILDSVAGIEVRAGFHCSALIHKALNTSDHGGTLRFSLGHSSTLKEMESVRAALMEISNEFN